MSNENLTPDASAPEFPRRIVLVRWLLSALEASLAIYLVIGYKLELGIVFIAYGVVCLFLLLPLIRCARCVYYGRRCSFGWGVWISKFFPRDEVDDSQAYYGYTILFWPLRILPIIVGLLGLLNGFIGKFTFVPHGLFGIYLLILLLHRLYYRKYACQGCELKTSCPIYDNRHSVWNTPG